MVNTYRLKRNAQNKNCEEIFEQNIFFWSVVSKIIGNTNSIMEPHDTIYKAQPIFNYAALYTFWDPITFYRAPWIIMQYN